MRFIFAVINNICAGINANALRMRYGNFANDGVRDSKFHFLQCRIKREQAFCITGKPRIGWIGLTEAMDDIQQAVNDFAQVIQACGGKHLNITVW